MQMQREDVEARVDKAILAAMQRSAKINRSDSLVLTLGFDSLRVASLAIALEDQLDRPILLNDWIASCSDPTALTVASLHEYVWQVLNKDV
jgi:acyl carrier protein